MWFNSPWIWFYIWARTLSWVLFMSVFRFIASWMFLKVIWWSSVRHYCLTAVRSDILLDDWWVIMTVVIITFCVMHLHSRGKMYSGHGHLCLSVCPLPHSHTTAQTRMYVTWGNGSGCPLVMHYWVNLQSVHWFHRYDNIAPNTKCQRVLILAVCLIVKIWDVLIRMNVLAIAKLFLNLIMIVVFGQPFVKWFALCYRSVVCPVCLWCSCTVAKRFDGSRWNLACS